jgi:hypothetical protein
MAAAAAVDPGWVEAVRGCSVTTKGVARQGTAEAEAKVPAASAREGACQAEAAEAGRVVVEALEVAVPDAATEAVARVELQALVKAVVEVQEMVAAMVLASMVRAVEAAGAPDLVEVVMEEMGLVEARAEEKAALVVAAVTALETSAMVEEAGAGLMVAGVGASMEVWEALVEVQMAVA